MSRTIKRGQDPRDPYTPTRQRVGSQGVPPQGRPTPRFVHDETVGVPTPESSVCDICGTWNHPDWPSCGCAVGR